MTVYKRDIVNFLFTISFPLYGIGVYISASESPSMGYIVSITPHILILLFYGADLVSRRQFQIRVNRWYMLMCLFLISCIVSLFVALHKHLPETSTSLALAKALLVVIPFQAFVAVHLYNKEEGALARLTFISLSLLLVINMLGYFVLGLRNEIHSIEGRINFPFIDGVYSGSCLLVIISLLLLYYFRVVRKDPVKLTGWAVYFFVNLLLLFLINSRLTILLFLVVSMLLMLNVIGKTRSLYWISIFTIPILLSTSLAIYKILTLPVFASLLKRVDVIDVTTFNGRAFLWKDSMDWLLYDRQGLILGNGYRGHYFFYLVSDVARLWNEKELYHLHLHSTSLEVLVCQGLLSYLFFLVLLYKVFTHYRHAFRNKTVHAAYFAVVVFLLFVMQVDTFLYMESSGFVIFAWLVSTVSVRSENRGEEKVGKLSDQTQCV